MRIKVTPNISNKQVKLIEGGDSNKTDIGHNESEKTPCSKSGGKRSADEDPSAEVGIEDLGERSINQPPKLKSVKIEKTASRGTWQFKLLTSV